MSYEEKPQPLFSEKLTRLLETCLRCGECNRFCPVYRVFELNEAYSPRGWVNLASQMNRRQLQVFIDLIEHMYGSVLCGLCDHPCPYGVRPSELILLTRKELIDLGYVPPLNVAALPRKIRTILSLFEPAAAEGSWLPPSAGDSPEVSETMMFVGRWALNAPESAVAAVELAIRFPRAVPIRDMRFSCGEILRLAGYFDEAREELDMFAEWLSDRGVRRVLTACPEAAKNLASKGIEAKMLLEDLLEYTEGFLLDKLADKIVVLVRDCWNENANSAARDLLARAGASVRSAEFCASCGYGVTYNARPDIIRRLGVSLLREAESNGASYLAFVHPLAYAAVKYATQGVKSKVKLVDVFQLLLQSTRRV